MRSLACSTLALAALALAADAGAQPQPAPDETAIAHGHYKTGEAYYTSGRYAEAAREFEEAYKFFGSRELLFNMGRAYDRAGDYVHASERYRRFLKDASGPDAVELQRRVDELAWHIAHVTVNAPAGATVRLDGAELGTAPLGAPLELNPGMYHFEVSRDGYATWSRAITLGDGGKQTLDAQLVPIGAPSAKTPLYKKWWLWTAVGVVVAAAAVTGGVLGAQSSSSSGVGSTLPVVK
jgi:tetratricopeptide (TPR) repeat protein